MLPHILLEAANQNESQFPYKHNFPTILTTNTHIPNWFAGWTEYTICRAYCKRKMPAFMFKNY